MNWLFLRGLYRQQRHWHEFPTVFERLVPGAKVHLLDLPGTGTEHARPSPASIPRIRDDVRERWLRLREREPEKDWSLLAVSLGGMVAMDWCARHPEDFCRLVLINTSARNVGKPWERLTPGAFRAFLRVARAADHAEAERGILGITTRMLGGRLDDLAREQARFAETAPISRSAALRQLWAARSFDAPAALRVPSLVLISRADELVNPECSHRIARRLGSDVLEHPDAGHDLTLDDPTWVAHAVTRRIPRR